MGLHPDALGVEGASDVEHAVAHEEPAVHGIDPDLAERDPLPTEVRNVIGHGFLLRDRVRRRRPHLTAAPPPRYTALRPAMTPLARPHPAGLDPIVVTRSQPDPHTAV